MTIKYLPTKQLLRERGLLSFFGSNRPKRYDELQESIETDGLLNPIFVVKSGKKYEVIDGHKRLNVIRRLNKTSDVKRWYAEIPCLIIAKGELDFSTPPSKPLLLSDQELAHNIIRDSYGQASLSKIAKRYACDLSTARQCLSLKNLNRRIFTLFSNGALSLGQAYEFSTLRNKKEQMDILLKFGPSASVSEIMAAVNSCEKHRLAGSPNSKSLAIIYHNQNDKNLIAA